MKNILLKNISGALLTVNIGQGRGLHILAGESQPVPAAVAESAEVARLAKRGFLSIIEEPPPVAPEKKKSKT